MQRGHRRAASWCMWVVVATAGCGDDGGGAAPDAAAEPEVDAGATATDASSGCGGDEDCDDGVYCNGEERCSGGTCQEGTPVECDDGIDCTTDSCSESTEDCRFEAPDADGDGHVDQTCLDADGEPLGDDCDDHDDDRYPGNTEVCDDHDEDCDPATVGFLDADGDAIVSDACCNGDICGQDCDDSDLERRVGQLEVCDDKDNDCDGQVDEEENSVEWYVDLDHDLYGGGEVQARSCTPVPGASLLSIDCNDYDNQRHPAQFEACDQRDNDCDGVADEGPDCGTPDGVTPLEDTDADDDGVPADADCDDDDDTLLSTLQDADCDGVLKDADCDDDDASSTVVAEDADCDGVLDGTVSLDQQPTDQTLSLATSVSIQIEATGGGTLAFSVQAGELPAGLSLDPSTGEISGTPAPEALVGGSPAGDYGGIVVRVSGIGQVDTTPFAISLQGVALPAPTLLWSYDDADLVDATTIGDLSGNGHHGSLIGGHTTGAAGIVGEAVTFDGSTGFAQATGVDTPAGDYSIVVVARATATGLDRIAAQFGMSSPSPAFRGTWLQVRADATASAIFEDGADRVATSSETVSAGVWTPLALTYDAAANTGRLYVDGTFRRMASTTGPVLYATDAFETGRHPQFNQRYWYGELDEAAFFHQRLDPEQVATVAWLARRGQSLASWLGL